MANDVATSLPALDYGKLFTLTVTVDDPGAVVSSVTLYGDVLNEGPDLASLPAPLPPLLPALASELS